MPRKTKYNDNFPLLAEDFARKGMIDKDIAAALGIGYRTFYEYIERYPLFAQALKRGKAPVDVEVENALLKKARGYEYEEVTMEYDLKGKETIDEKAKPTKIKKTKKMVIADTLAMIFWLKNRRPKIWRDRKDVELSGMDGEAIKITYIAAKKKGKKNERNDT